MTDRRPPPDVLDVVRTRRIELYDSAGRQRALLGDLATGPDANVVGLSLNDEDGHPRAWLAMHDCGVDLTLGLGGNVVAILGVYDHVPTAVMPGTHFVLCDAHGAEVLRAHVTLDGELVRRPPPAR